MEGGGQILEVSEPLYDMIILDLVELKLTVFTAN